MVTISTTCRSKAANMLLRRHLSCNWSTSIVCVCEFLLATSNVGTTAALPKQQQPSNRYDQYAEEIQQWQFANPSVCGEDTTNCRVERLIDQFEECEAPVSNPYRIINGCVVTQHNTIGWQVAVHINGSLCSGTMVKTLLR